MRGTWVELVTEAGTVKANVGTPDTAGVEWWVEELDGWDLSTPEHEVTERTGADGAWIDAGRYPSRVVTVRGAYKQNQDEARRILSRILATARRQGTITVTELDGSVRQSGYVARASKLERVGKSVAPRWEVTLVCDAFKYGATLNTVTVSASTATVATEGRTYDKTYDVVYFTAGQTEERPSTAVVAGDTRVWPVIRFNGPTVNPEIELTSTGQIVAATITLGPGDYLEIDTAGPSALLNGSAPRLGAVTTDTEFFALAPGANPLRFASSDPAATAVVMWRDAYL